MYFNHCVIKQKLNKAIGCSFCEGEECVGRENGAAYVTRTRDPIITNDVLYRLS